MDFYFVAHLEAHVPPHHTFLYPNLFTAPAHQPQRHIAAATDSSLPPSRSASSLSCGALVVLCACLPLSSPVQWTINSAPARSRRVAGASSRLAAAEGDLRACAATRRVADTDTHDQILSPPHTTGSGILCRLR
jgi:hypothetical protein